MIWLAIPVGIVVAWLIMREPYMRSARVAALVGTTTLIAAALFAVTPGWSFGEPAQLMFTAVVAGLGVVAALVPIWIVNHWEPAFSALSQSFYAEHRLIRSTRDRLRADDSREAVVSAQSAISEMGAPPDGWQPARQALVEQLSVAAALRHGDPVPPNVVAEAAHRTLSAWRSAIERTRTFFR